MVSMFKRDRQQDDPLDARRAVQRTIEEAVSLGASDVHLEPTAEGYELRYRVDGLLRTHTQLEPTVGRAYVNRLMVAGKLLTYRLDIPQEGRCTFRVDPDKPAIDLRVSVMPTAHGLRMVVRLPAELHQPQALDALGLPTHLRAGLQDFIDADSGMLLLTGPAGSGKTTTIYALLEAILAQSTGLSIVSLEDPIERDVPSVTQIEVTPFGELTYERALRSILRQDPQVLALGEIRDRATASIAVQAALSGHRLISTLHAGTPTAAIVRLLEMGIEPYQIVSALSGAASLRLMRRLHDEHGYHGRVPVGEFVRMDEALRAAVLNGSDATTMHEAARQQTGFTSMQDDALALIRRGVTDAAEAQRVLGQRVTDTADRTSP